MAAEDIAKRWVELLNRHDVNAMAEIFAPDVVVYDPGQTQPLRGREAWQRNAEQFWLAAFPDMQARMINFLSQGDTAAVELAFSGTNTGPLPGPAGPIPPTNKRFEFSGVGVWRLDAQGRILEERRYYDTASIMRQLGLIAGP